MDIGFDRGFFLPLRRQEPPPSAEGVWHGIWISQDDITPANAGALKKTLNSEAAHPKYWITLAFCYRGVGEVELFEHFLKEADARLDGAGKAVYSALAMHNFMQAEQFAHQEKRHARHTDLANHYISRKECSGHYTWHLSMAQYHLSRFLSHHQYEERLKAKEYFHAAMTLRPHSVVAMMYYANMLTLENQYQMASIYYMRALMRCNHTEILLRLRKDLAQNASPNVECQYDQMLLHSRRLKALILYALACCKFYEFDIGGAITLTEASLNTAKTPMALRLKATIAATQILQNEPNQDVDTTPPSAQPTPRPSFETVVSGWSESTSAAYVLDPSNGIGQLHLCEFLFQHGMIDECQSKLNEIKRNLLPTILHAEHAYQIGRCFHAKGEMSKAFTMYSNVLDLRSDFLPARIQLIKAAVGSNGLAIAREHCEILSKYNYRNLDILRLTGFVYMASASETMDTCQAQMFQRESKVYDIDHMGNMNYIHPEVGRLIDERLFKALGLLEEALNVEPDDKLSQEYLIYCLELLINRGRDNFTPRLRAAYVKYFQMEDTNNSVELRNNDAILAFRSRECDEGISKLIKLWEEISESTEVSDAIKLTVQFNLAVAYEETGKHSKAHKMYSQITCDYPKYTPAWLRKSSMAFRRGDMESAHRYLEQLKEHTKRSLEPWLYKAYQFFDKKIMTSVSRNSVNSSEVLHYARAGLRRHALSNFYAANCVAIYLAQEGNLKAAYESFGILLENAGNNAHMKFIAHRNMGLFCVATALGNERRLERGNYDKIRAAKAQQHLQTAIGLCSLDPAINLIYARFLYDCQRLEECVEFLEDCRRLFPRDRKFLYNLVIAIDAFICKAMRNSEVLTSATEVSRMLTNAYFAKTAAAHLIAIQSEYPKMSLTHLQQISSRMTEKLIPHMQASVPQLEAAAEAKQLTKGKHLELQMSLQQAHEAKRAEMELERQRAAEAERMLSEQLLKEASDIASELVYARAPGPGPSGSDR
ncbi:tetratricopeptide repeat (TPR) domain containing protein [Babesia divergens]|uniref:Tetratricopeptide repeat (TPR) domain containing protein n=1 Tax=Babesia divergens TaxID=32595 RepID=A0AAD9LJ78_BABDI|nr:tetratricopeptide repeat (TPR) domain containing protein [Babesia divergens]